MKPPKKAIELFKHAMQRVGFLFGLLFSFFFIGNAHAGFITTNEAGMDAVFSQSAFGATPIDIRFNAPQFLYNTSLLSIDNNAELTQILGINSFNSRTVDMFFVDHIGYCGGSGSNIIGCGQLPGNSLILDSSWAATTYGAALESHELGHNLGLSHVSGQNTNLMNPILWGSTFLSTSQALTIFGSNLVQIDNFGQRYISINPIAVVSSVPEPTTALLLAVGVGFIARRGKKNAPQAA